MIDRERGLEFKVSKVEDRSCSKGESKGLGLGEGVRADEFLMERGEFRMMLFLSFFFFFFLLAEILCVNILNFIANISWKG